MGYTKSRLRESVTTPCKVTGIWPSHHWACWVKRAHWTTMEVVETIRPELDFITNISLGLEINDIAEMRNAVDGMVDATRSQTCNSAECWTHRNDWTRNPCQIPSLDQTVKIAHSISEQCKLLISSFLCNIHIANRKVPNKTKKRCTLRWLKSTLFTQ